MYCDTVLQKSPRLATAPLRHVVPVLIEVPTISVIPGTHSCQSAGVDSHSVCRRRLRREVRVVGYILLTVFALTNLISSQSMPAGMLLSSLLPKRSELNRTNLPASSAPPLISISIEPVALVPSAEASHKVVFPGYLLPDDGPEEEPADAGY